eukprot:2616806-Prymnesium_polylepis.1
MAERGPADALAARSRWDASAGRAVRGASARAECCRAVERTGRIRAVAPRAGPAKGRERAARDHGGVPGELEPARQLSRLRRRWHVAIRRVRGHDAVRLP